MYEKKPVEGKTIKKLNETFANAIELEYKDPRGNPKALCLCSINDGLAVNSLFNSLKISLFR